MLHYIESPEDKAKARVIVISRIVHRTCRVGADEDDRRRTAQALRMARAALDYRRSDVATPVGIAVNTLWNLERAETPRPRRVTVAALLAFYQGAGVTFLDHADGGYAVAVTLPPADVTRVG